MEKGKRLVVILAALALIFGMTAVYLAGILGSIFGGGGSQVTTTTQAEFCGSWPSANVSVSVVPGYPGLEGFIESKKEGPRTWSVYVYVRNNGTDVVQVPWLSDEGIKLLVYNVVGYRILLQDIKFNNTAPLLRPGDVAVAYRRFTIKEGAPLPAYAIAYSPSTGLVLGTWMINPISTGSPLSCGHTLVEGDGYRILERWIQLRFGLVMYEAVLQAISDVQVSPGSPTFVANIYDSESRMVLKMNGPRNVNSTFTVPSGSYYVIGVAGKYSLGQPSRIETTINLTLDGVMPLGYDGDFGNDGFREEYPGIWKTKTLELTNGSVALLVEVVYNGYLLGVRNVSMVAQAGSLLLVPEDFATAKVLFGAAFPGAVVKVKLAGNQTEEAVYIASRIGGSLKQNGTVTIGNKTYYRYVFVESSVELNKLIGTDLEPSSAYTMFYAPLDEVQTVVVEAPWGSEAFSLSAIG